MAKDGYGEMCCISCCVSPLDPENENLSQHPVLRIARVNVLKLFFFGLNPVVMTDVIKTTKYLISNQSVTKFLNSNKLKANFENLLTD